MLAIKFAMSREPRNLRLPSGVMSLVAIVLLAQIAWGSPGIDLSANGICPGVTGASLDGGAVDCAALVATGRFVRLYGTLMTAEAIADLGALEGRIEMWVDAPSASSSFWNSAPGSCLDSHGGAAKFLGTKPTNGDPCGNVATIREAFTGGAQSFAIYDVTSNRLEYYFSVCRGTGLPVTTAQRLFGFEMRFDPAFGAEVGGPCGSCKQAVFFQWVSARPISLSGMPTTTLTTPTYPLGPYDRNVGGYNLPICDCFPWYPGCCQPPLPGSPLGSPPPYGCAPVSTRPHTWGLLKSLYR